MPPKKKHKNSLHGSSKMARLLGASRPAATVKSFRNKSNVAGAPCVDAAIATPMVPLDESPPLTLAVDSLKASADVFLGSLGSSDPSSSVAVDDISPSSTGPMDLSFSVFQVEITLVVLRTLVLNLYRSQPLYWMRQLLPLRLLPLGTLLKLRKSRTTLVSLKLHVSWKN